MSAADPMMPVRAPKAPLWLLALLTLGAAFAVRTYGAMVLPILQDEAYYGLWSRALAAGYYDHPPLIALLAWTTNLAPGSAAAARLGTLILSLGLLGATVYMLRALGLTDWRAILAALLTAQCNFMALSAGFLTTPDALLFFFWALAVAEGARALSGQRSRWLYAGVATGLGLLSKYTMILIVPAFLFALWRSDRTALRGRWPYLGAAAALLLFLPHLLWNAQHDWITMGFQLRHGFGIEAPTYSPAPFPPPTAPSDGDLEEQLAGFFAPSEIHAPRPTLFSLGKLNVLTSTLHYALSQLALLGFLVVPLAMVVGRRRARFFGATPLARGPLSLAWAAAAWPLLFFAFTGFFVGAEPNWPAVYLLSASALAGLALKNNLRLITAAAAGNLFILVLLITHGRIPFLPISPDHDRLLKETHGYRNLAHYLSSENSPVFTESFQTTAKLRFYGTGSPVGQWPGLSRDSELTRPKATLRLEALAALQQQNAMRLVLTQPLAPRLAGFRLSQLHEVRDCRSRPLAVTQAYGNGAMHAPACAKPLHLWYVASYERSDRNDLMP